MTPTIAPPTKITGKRAGTVPTASIVAGIQKQLASSTVLRKDAEDYNVVLILIDDAGREKFSWSGLGSNYPALTRLDGFRSLGVTFQNAYATPICGPTRATIQTGKYGKSNGLGGNIEDTDLSYRLSDTNILIPEALNLGRPAFTYARAAFGKWHMCGYQGQDSHPFDNGFARYFGLIPNAGPSATLNWFNGMGHFRWRKVTTATTFNYVPNTWAPPTPPALPIPFPDGLGAYDSTTYDACVNTRDALAWINSRTQPFFCYLPINPPHDPFERPPNTMPDNTGFGATGGTLQLVPTSRQNEMDGLGVVAVGQVGTPGAQALSVFKGAMECVDTLIGWLYDRMDPAKRAKTVFVLWNDNGTVADVVEAPYNPGHAKRTTYEQGVWGTGIIWGPPALITDPGRDHMGMAHSVDLCRTIGDICKVRWDLVGEGAASDSRSLMPILLNPNAPPVRNRIYSEIFLPLGGPPALNQWQRALSDGTWKLTRGNAISLATTKFFRVGATPGFASGQPGYLEIAADDYYPTIATTAPADAKAAFAALSAEMLTLTGYA